MIFDTDILIWAQRGNNKAIKLIENAETFTLSRSQPSRYQA